MLDLFEYFFLSLPAVALSSWAQGKVLWACMQGSRVTTARGLTGAEMAELLLKQANLAHVTIEALNWELGDYHDPRDHVLYLSPAVFHGASVTSVAITAHEIGHAVQDAAGYRPIWLRNTVVPVTSLASQLFWLLIAAGLLLSMTKLILAGLVLLISMLLLQVLNVPVEYDASRRGQALLAATGMIRPEEEQAIANVLKAIPWTYVAAAFWGVSLPRLVLRWRFAR